MNNNDKEIREILESEEVPEEISPENIKTMLDEKSSVKKRRKISVAGRVTATAAACAIIVGATAGSVHLLRNLHTNCGMNTGNYIGDYTADSNYSGDSDGVPYETGTDENGNKFAVYSSDTATVEQVNAPYMNGAESYEQIYRLIEKSDKKYKSMYQNLLTDDYSINSFKGTAINGAEMAETARDEEAFDAEYDASPAEEGFDGALTQGTDNILNPDIDFEPDFIPDSDTDADTNTDTDADTNTDTDVDTDTDTNVNTDNEADTSETGKEYSETYNQEAGVLEADIVKTDGEKIYYLTNKWITGGYDDDGVYWNYMGNSYNVPVINIASVDNGTFTDSLQLDVTPETYLDDGWEQDIYVNDMYLYNDMIAVIGHVYSHNELYDEESGYYNFEDDSRCFVSFYTKDAEFIGTYWQDGSYNDVRISPDGYMYLVSDYSSARFDEIIYCENYRKYIPECGTDDSVSCIPAEDILIPEKELDNCSNLSYTIIGSIGLTVSAQFTPVNTKAVAGYAGTLYTSADNLYYTTPNGSDTDITRISISEGNITPCSSATVEGYVKDQFSMNEYNGYFRIATTVSKYINHGNFFTDMLDIRMPSEYIQDNRVYVLDMDLNQVGFIGGFGENESIKSVNFSGNMGYVVTYERTDPLFAIDLSNPAEPFITDEFKILGYSTYMQKWTDGLLLGFGVDADENGVQTGIKVVMFDNSDPYNLQEAGLFSVNNTDNSYIGSSGTWDRKSLLIAPEKNLIGIPLTVWDDDTMSETSKYMFLSYENGEFVPKGEIAKTISYDNNYNKYDVTYYDRALYIGGYVYALSADKFVSADIDTITVTDEVNFVNFD